MASLRSSTYRLLESAQEGDVASLIMDVFLLFVVGVSICSFVLQTVDEISLEFENIFSIIDRLSFLVFAIEYLLRLWTCVENPRFHSPVRGRLRYAITPMAIIDLLAFLPGLIRVADLRMVRILRLFRLLRAMKAVRYIAALVMIREVIQERRDELVMTLVFMLFMLVMISSVMYEVEHDAQPLAFSSIPATMWWGVASLTTMGYGDIYPITAIGKVLAGMFALLGIGVFAIPTGILASGFSDKLVSMKTARLGADKPCPHCGK